MLILSAVSLRPTDLRRASTSQSVCKYAGADKNTYLSANIPKTESQTSRIPLTKPASAKHRREISAAASEQSQSVRDLTGNASEELQRIPAHA